MTAGDSGWSSYSCATAGATVGATGYPTPPPLPGYATTGYGYGCPTGWVESPTTGSCLP